MWTFSLVAQSTSQAPIVIICCTVFNKLCCISITNQCPKTPFSGQSKDFPRTLKGLVKTHSRAKISPSFLWWCPRVVGFWCRQLNRPLCSPAPYLVTFDLFGQRDQLWLHWEKGRDAPAQFHFTVKPFSAAPSLGQQRHVRTIRHTFIQTKWKYMASWK